MNDHEVVNDQPPERRAELVANLRAVQGRIATACAAAGRPQAGDLTLIAVTKTHPASDVAALVELGITDMGENRDQEAQPKSAQLRALLGAAAPRWHFIGQLQRNKARGVAHYACAVHSVDRPGLITALAAARAAAVAAGAGDAGLAAPLEVFIQVSLDGDQARGGALPAAVLPLADLVATAPSLALRGVMAVAPRQAQPERAFASLAEISAQLRAQHPQASAISAGMSHDLEAALAYGATHLRIGTALLGRRAPLVG